MANERINYEEFKIFREIPVLTKLRNKKLLDKYLNILFLTTLWLII